MLFLNLYVVLGDALKHPQAMRHGSVLENDVLLGIQKIYARRCPQRVDCSLLKLPYRIVGVDPVLPVKLGAVLLLAAALPVAVEVDAGDQIARGEVERLRFGDQLEGAGAAAGVRHLPDDPAEPVAEI